VCTVLLLPRATGAMQNMYMNSRDRYGAGIPLVGTTKSKAQAKLPTEPQYHEMAMTAPGHLTPLLSTPRLKPLGQHHSVASSSNIQFTHV